MKLRFGLDLTAYERLRDTLDAAAPEPPVGKRLSYVYLDTPEDDLAGHGVALRFRRSAAAGAAAPARGWRRQMLWAKDGPQSLKALSVPRLKQRVDATFTIRIERWTWQPRTWAEVSLDRIAISTGRVGDETVEMQHPLPQKASRRGDAVGRGAWRLASRLATRTRAWTGVVAGGAGPALTRLERCLRDGGARPRL